MHAFVEPEAIVEGTLASETRFETAVPAVPAGDSGLARALREIQSGPKGRASRARSRARSSSVMELGVSVIAELREAPPRTPRGASVVRSSPLELSLREMIETRAFGKSYAALALDLEHLDLRLPPLGCPAGGVAFLASDRSLEDLSLCVDGLLLHRKRLIEATVERGRPRRHVLVLGAGPGGLMTAIELRLRDHSVVVCEAREVYTRNRFIGIYKESAHLLASLGMPERMTYDFTHYRGKRGVMIADIQTFLHAVALKLGVVIYTGAVARNLGAEALRAGEIELQRHASAGSGSHAPPAVGMTRWHHDAVARVASGVAIRFDTIVEATGGRSGLRELLVGAGNVVSMRSLGRSAAELDPSLRSYLDDPEDHSAELVQSYYGGAGLLDELAAALARGDDESIPDELPCFVSNIDASILKEPMRPTGKAAGRGARIGDNELEIPRDWAVVQCPRTDRTLTRYQIEGPLPRSFEYGNARVATVDVLASLNPVGLLLRILYAMGVPFDAVDRRRLIDFYTAESSYGDATDIVATWVGRFRSLRLGGQTPIVWGNVAGSDVTYGIVGEALQNAWYRFGVGVDDTFVGATRFGAALELGPPEREEAARRHERAMLARCVQVLCHLFSVARNTDQGVVGPVLTEYYLDERHSADLTEASLREEARQGAEILAVRDDLPPPSGDRLLDRALDARLERCCRRALGLLVSFPYDRATLARAGQRLQTGDPDWRRHATSVLVDVLTPAHREMLLPLFAPRDPGSARAANATLERLLDLAMGRYAWVSPWLRACALCALDPAEPGSIGALERAATDADPLVAQTAATALLMARGPDPATAGEPAPSSIVEKVVILSEVSIFRAIPHEVLAGLAALLTERQALPGDRIIEKGELGDCLYVIASGRVRVHDGETTLNELGDHGFFGELSLLDAEPRSASVSAIQPSRLLRLAQADFYSIMSERVEIAPAINRVLCEKIRRASRAT